jgi:hypothetical protein
MRFLCIPKQYASHTTYIKCVMVRECSKKDQSCECQCDKCYKFHAIEVRRLKNRCEEMGDIRSITRNDIRRCEWGRARLTNRITGMRHEPILDLCLMG